MLGGGKDIKTILNPTIVDLEDVTGHFKAELLINSISLLICGLKVCKLFISQQTKNRDTEFWRTTAKHRYFGTTMVYIQKLNWI